jgi:hypothetical protein
MLYTILLHNTPTYYFAKKKAGLKKTFSDPFDAIFTNYGYPFFGIFSY